MRRTILVVILFSLIASFGFVPSITNHPATNTLGINLRLGAYVEGITPQDQRIGLLPGDFILTVDGKEFDSLADLTKRLPGELVIARYDYQRDRSLPVRITLERPLAAELIFAGIVVGRSNDNFNIGDIVTTVNGTTFGNPTEFLGLLQLDMRREVSGITADNLSTYRRFASSQQPKLLNDPLCCELCCCYPIWNRACNGSGLCPQGTGTACGLDMIDGQSCCTIYPA